MITRDDRPTTLEVPDILNLDTAHSWLISKSSVHVQTDVTSNQFVPLISRSIAPKENISNLPSLVEHNQLLSQNQIKLHELLNQKDLDLNNLWTTNEQIVKENSDLKMKLMEAVVHNANSNSKVDNQTTQLLHANYEMQTQVS